VVAVGPDAPAAERARWAALRAGTVGDFGLGLFPARPREAVGGFPVLVRRGAVAPEVDTAGAATFRGPNPRTAVGIAADGGLLLVTVDGRQPGHSDGATLRETAELLQALGAVDALNLDGGGSTTMVVRGAGERLAVVNRPSDTAGERPVANALAVHACPGSALTSP
jgi:exopolysaccharide biosynthesis protein